MNPHTQPHPEMAALLAQFPVIHKVKLDYWPYDVDLEHLRDVYGPSSSGERAAIEFLLSVWDHSHDWSKDGFRNFNLAGALGSWGSSSSTEAVIAWMKKPFHP